MTKIKIAKMTLGHYSNVIDLWKESEIKIEKEDSYENLGTDLRYGYIHHLAVKKSYRNNGIGKK